jgi:predicted nucleic acid-binding protein
VRTADPFMLARRVYLDSNVLIYLLEGDGELGRRARRAIGYLADRQRQIVTSELTFAECLRGPARQDNGPAMMAIRDYFLGIGAPMLVPVTRAIIDRTVYMPAFKLIDAIHAATAIATESDLLLTNDHAFTRLTKLKVTLLSELE